MRCWPSQSTLATTRYYICSRRSWAYRQLNARILFLYLKCMRLAVFIAGWPRMCADWHVPPISFLFQFKRCTYIHTYICIYIYPYIYVQLLVASSSALASFNRTSAVCRPVHSLRALTRLKSKSHWKNDMRWRLKWNPMSRVKWRKEEKKENRYFKACGRMRWTIDGWLLRRRACTRQATKQSLRAVYILFAAVYLTNCANK